MYGVPHVVFGTKDKKCTALHLDSGWEVKMDEYCPARQVKLGRVIWGEELLVPPAGGGVGGSDSFFQGE